MDHPPSANRPGKALRNLAAVVGVAAVIGAVAWNWPRLRAKPGAPRLGAHALVGQEDQRADAVAVTPPLDVAAHGSSLLAFVAGYRTNDAAPTDSAGNQWRLLGAPEAYRGYDGRFDMRAYVAEQARGAHDLRVSVHKPGEPRGELTLVAVEARDAARLVGIARSYPQAALRQVSDSVTTTGPALLVALWWGDAKGLEHRVLPGSGFRVIEDFTRLPPNSAVQAVVAVREVDHAGTWRASWYAWPRQGAVLWLLAFARDPAGPAPPP